MLFNISNSIYQLFQSNTKNLHTAVWFQLTINNNSKQKNQQFYLTLTGTITLDPSGPKSNNNEWVLHVP